MVDLQVFKIKAGIKKDWDDVNLETEIEIVATIEGKNEKECEAKAVKAGFGDTDVYGWSYNETV